MNKMFYKKIKVMLDKNSKINLDTCDSKKKDALEILQDVVTLWLAENQTRVNPHDVKPNVVKACERVFG